MRAFRHAERQPPGNGTLAAAAVAKPVYSCDASTTSSHAVWLSTAQDDMQRASWLVPGVCRHKLQQLDHLCPTRYSVTFGAALQCAQCSEAGQLVALTAAKGSRLSTMSERSAP
jgi:hypothetical protein